MRNILFTHRLFLLIIAFCFAGLLKAQETPNSQVVNVDFELKNTRIITTYDIVNHADSDKFTVSIKIQNAKGESISATALTGDIDSNITGGYNKRIVWDLMKDQIILDDSITVKVEAVVQNPEMDKND